MTLQRLGYNEKNKRREYHIKKSHNYYRHIIVTVKRTVNFLVIEAIEQSESDIVLYRDVKHVVITYILSIARKLCDFYDLQFYVLCNQMPLFPKQMISLLELHYNSNQSPMQCSWFSQP